MLFISHNLGLVLETCDRICVMYSGEAVETGSIKDVFDKMQHPYTQALFRSIPLPGADKNARPLVAIPGNFPLPHERPDGCNFGPRCDYFEAGRCDAADIPMQDIAGEDRHGTRCLSFTEIDWHAPVAATIKREKAPIGEVVLRMDNLKKYYEVAANALFGGGETKVVKANETLSFEARESETLAIVGESGCGKSTFAKVLMGLETATEGRIILDGREIQDIPIEKRDTGDDRRCPDGVPEPVRHAQPLDDRSAGRSSARSKSSRSARTTPTGASGCCICSTWSSCPAPSPTGCRGNCRAARNSASASPAPLPAAPASWSPTSRSRRSTCRCRRRSPTC